MNISWCYFPIQHTVQSGWQILIPHEDKSMLLFIYSSIQHIVQRGWQSLIPYEDKLMLLPHLTYCSEGGCRFWFVIKDKLMSLFIYSSIQHIVQREWQSLIPYEDKLILLPPLTYCSEGGCRFWFIIKDKLMSLFIYSPIQHIVQREWQSLIPFEDKLILLPHLTYCSEGGCRFWFIIKDKLMSLFIYSPIQHIVQREWQSLIPFEDKLILLPHLTYCSEGGGADFDSS